MSKNRLDAFERLARAARRDMPPLLDVSHQVIFRIECLDQGIDRPLAWLTAGSLAAAAAAAAVTFSFYSSLSEPFGLLLHVTPMLGH